MLHCAVKLLEVQEGHLGDAGVAVVITGEDKDLEDFLQVRLYPSEYISTALAMI